MYTEDDEKVKVKSDKSNVKYEDFYTSFNDIEKDDKKTKKSKKKTTKPKEVPVKDEEDYQDFYGSGEEEENIDNSGKKSIIKIIGLVLLFIIIIALLIFLFVIKRSPKGDIELAKDNIALNIGQKEYISYKIVNTESNVTSKFVSADENIAIVSSDGEITAIGIGETTITIYYTIDNTTRDKKCVIKVNNDGSVDESIRLTLKLENGKDNTWTNKDVTITPEASSIFGIESIKYGVNCNNDCEYKNITDNKITISSSGVTKVKIIAKDKKNQETTKEVTIKIDKEAPKVTLNSNTNITSNKDVEVCATCSDSVSGCKQGKVCKKFTASKSGQTITVEDNAGNKSTSKAFNVTITKTVAPCTLRVSSDGTVTATLREEATYYGFNSSYSGPNELSKKISISASKAGEQVAKLVYYYVKNKSGSSGRCFLTVVKTCACANNTTGSNCTVSCTFKSQ